MSSTPFLPLRIEHEGRVVVTDGVLMCLFLRESHRDAAESVGRLYDHWLRVVGPDSVRWVRGADDWKELTARQRTRLRKKMTRSGATEAEVRVAVKGGDDPDDLMVHGFDYWGMDLSEDPDAASLVEMRFTTDWVMARGLDAFAALALDRGGAARRPRRAPRPRRARRRPPRGTARAAAAWP